MSAARDLAGAIYDELVADYTAAAVLDLWQHRHVGASDIDDMRKVLAFVAAYAIEAVLARGESEAARTGPWDTDPNPSGRKGNDRRRGETPCTERGEP